MSDQFEISRRRFLAGSALALLAAGLSRVPAVRSTALPARASAAASAVKLGPRFTIPQGLGGTYLISGHAVFGGGGVSTLRTKLYRQVAPRIYREVEGARSWTQGETDHHGSLSQSTVMSLLPGDVIELEAFHKPESFRSHIVRLDPGGGEMIGAGDDYDTDGFHGWDPHSQETLALPEPKSHD